ncbi:MAG: hypothetical protein LBE08_10405 [Bifidobacteriaceae bacterium]|jgi:hypothetical protein|nr:hypothetical protein [Bifidobacteriaceae bacterium]
MSTAKKPQDRIEVYEALRPDGSAVRITRNIETGKREVAVLAAAAPKTLADSDRSAREAG